MADMQSRFASTLVKGVRFTSDCTAHLASEAIAIKDEGPRFLGRASSKSRLNFQVDKFVLAGFNELSSLWVMMFKPSSLRSSRTLRAHSLLSATRCSAEELMTSPMCSTKNLRSLVFAPSRFMRLPMHLLGCLRKRR